MYQGDVCLGSGVIDEVGKSLKEKKQSLPDEVLKLAQSANY